MNFSRYLAGLTAASACLTFHVQAAEPPPSGNGVMTFPHVSVITAATPGSARASHGEMLGFRDPATGKLTQPTAAQAAALAATQPTRARSTATATASAKPVRLPNGGLKMMLPNQHQRYSLACKDARGAVITDCEAGRGAGADDEK